MPPMISNKVQFRVTLLIPPLIRLRITTPMPAPRTAARPRSPAAAAGTGSGSASSHTSRSPSSDWFAALWTRDVLFEPRVHFGGYFDGCHDDKVVSQTRIMFSAHTSYLLTSIQELLKFLDDVALDVFTSGGVGVFPYKSFGEVVNLVMISMLREVLRNSGEFLST